MTLIDNSVSKLLMQRSASEYDSVLDTLIKKNMKTLTKLPLFTIHLNLFCTLVLGICTKFLDMVISGGMQLFSK